MFRLLMISLLFLPLAAHAQPVDETQNLTIEAIQCRGNSHTDCLFIQENLQLSIGVGFDDKAINDASFRLSLMPNFESSRIYLEKGSRRNKVIVILEVVEASPWVNELYVGGVQFAPHNQVVAGLRLSHHNVFGKSKILDFANYYREFSENNFDFWRSYSKLQYIDPHLFNHPNYFISAGLSYYQEELDSFEKDHQEREQSGLTFTLGRRFGDFSYLTIGKNYYFSRNVSIIDRNADGSANNFVFNNRMGGLTTVGDEIEFHAPNYNSVIISYGWDTQNNPYFPSAGSQFNVTGQLGEISSVDEKVNAISYFYQKSWAIPNGAVARIKLDTPKGNIFPAVQNSPLLLTPIEPYLKRSVLGIYAKPLFLGKTTGGHLGEWRIDAGYVELYGRDDLAPSLGLGLRVKSNSFGIVNVEFRFTHDE